MVREALRHLQDEDCLGLARRKTKRSRVYQKNSFRPFNEAEAIPETAVGPESSGSIFSPYSPR